MDPSAAGGARKRKVGGFAALYLAAAYLVAMPFFLLFVKYHEVVDPTEKVTLLVRDHASMQVMYLITYVVFGLVLAVLVLSVHARLGDGAPTLARAATVAGLVWAVVLVASGMIFNAGMAAVVGLHGAAPAQAVAVWQAIEPVADGLGGSGGELLGGLWVLLVSVAALRIARLPKGLCWLGVVVGGAGVGSVVPALSGLAYGFGMLQIVWFAWLGVVLLRTPARQAAPALDSAEPTERGSSRLSSATS